MSDGCRLAARIWVPQVDTPVPALIEYIPYRKRDGTRVRDEAMHRYFAGHGYAAVRIDLRGSGDSDGVLEDEYLDQELDDGVAAIQWVARQPWCNGSVGIIGKSWGGFNALQIASRRPAPLQAVISVCAADDRYADDAHYMGGCLLNENQIWGAILFTLNALPPDPLHVGDAWRKNWLARLEQNRPFPALWLRHQRRDEYWRHGSICEDFAAIGCPVLAVSGWADGYSNAVPRLLANLAAPCRGLIGPWGHQYPHEGVPGPAIDFLGEAMTWWDQWLKGREPDHAEPAYRVWMPTAGAGSGRQTGHWLAEPGWPAAGVVPVSFSLGAAGLRTHDQAPVEIHICSPQTTGLAAGSWCAFGYQGELPLDQREDDAKSLCFDEPARTATVEILGAPELVLTLASTEPVASVIVRLNDVAPDGHSSRVTYGVLNLTHRDGHDDPRPLVPAETIEVCIKMNDVAYRLRAGHRFRLAISTVYWPLLWPAPRPVTLTVRGGRLTLPVRAPNAADDLLRPFGPPAHAQSDQPIDMRDIGSFRQITRDADTGRSLVETRTDMSADGKIALELIEPIGLISGHGILERFEIAPDDPLSARAHIFQRAEVRRGDWRVRVATTLTLTADANSFLLEASLVAHEGESRVFKRAWRERIARDLV